MRGVVYTGERVDVTDQLEVREPGPTEVRVSLRAAGVCHSDLSVIDGTIPFPPPVVLGHEGAGVVDAVGSAVTTVKPGDHVVMTTLAYCGACGECVRGHPTRCRRSMGNLPQPFTYEGQATYAFASTAAFAEATVVSEVQAVKIADDVPFESACLIGCGVITGAGAVFNRAKVERGDRVAVLGVGGIGLNVIQAAAIAGASTIVAIDTVASKESLAREFGATAFVLASAAGSGDTASSTDNVAKVVRKMVPPRLGTEKGGFGAGGVDWAFECVGHPAVIRNAVDMLDWGGTCVIIGVPAPNAELTSLVTPLTHVDRGILGCRYGSARPHHDIPLLVELYKQGRLKLDELVTKTYPLDRFEDVVADMKDGALARGVLQF